MSPKPAPRLSAPRKNSNYEQNIPQEVGSLLKVRSNGENLVDQILHADNAVLAQVGFDDRVIGESNPLLVDLSISTLVDKLTNRL